MKVVPRKEKADPGRGRQRQNAAGVNVYRNCTINSNTLQHPKTVLEMAALARRLGERAAARQDYRAAAVHLDVHYSLVRQMRGNGGGR